MNLLEQLNAASERIDAALDVVDDPHQDVSEDELGTLAVLGAAAAIFIALCT